jgi:hypothetical protein
MTLYMCIAIVCFLILCVIDAASQRSMLMTNVMLGAFWFVLPFVVTYFVVKKYAFHRAGVHSKYGELEVSAILVVACGVFLAVIRYGGPLLELLRMRVV